MQKGSNTRYGSLEQNIDGANAPQKGAFFMPINYVYTPKSVFDAWEHKWRPFLNPFDSDADWGGAVFESHGEQLQKVEAQDPRRIWTLIRVGRCGESLVPGFYPGNALGFLITKKKRSKTEEAPTIIITPDNCALHWNLC